MAKRILRRRGTTVQTSTFTGGAGELTVDSDKNTVVVHDGVTVGGFPLARASATVTSVNGLNGVVTGIATLAANTFTGTQALGDNQVTQALLRDCGYVAIDKGNSGAATVTFDYTAGSVQTLTITGISTIDTSNWPPTGNMGELLIKLVNGGAFSVTLPAISYVLPSGLFTTTLATYMTAIGRTSLQSAGTDFLFLFSDNAGATVYGKFL